MSGSGTQSLARQAEVVVTDLGTEQGGSICPDIGAYLLGGDTICPGIRVREMGPDNAHAEVAGHIPP